MRTLVVVLTLLVASSSAAWAAPLSGQVLDGSTLEPIAGAIVSVQGTALSSTTDRNGRYAFDDVPPGVLVLRIEAAGYDPSDESIDLDADGVADLVLILLPPGVTGEVLEVADRPPMIATAPGETQLTREELVKVPGARGDAMQVVKSLPGVANADAVGSGPGLLVIRGAAPEDSLFLMDGVMIPLVYHFFGLQSVIPSEFIDDIEFLPGGFGVEHGRATGGIIHIKTRPNRAREVGGFAELSFINVAGYLEGPLWKKHDLNFTVAFRRGLIDVILPAVIPESANLSFTTAPQYYDSQLRLDWRASKVHTVSLMGLVSFDLLSLLSENENPNDPTATGSFDNETSFTRLNLIWRAEKGPVESVATASIGNGEFRIEIGSDRYLRGEGLLFVLREDLKVKLGPKLTLRAGGDLEINRGEFAAKFPLPPQEGSADMPNFTTDPLVEMNSTFDDDRYAAFAAVDITPIPALRVTPGLRLDYFRRYDATALLPRVSASYELDDRWTARLAIGAYARPVDQAEALATDLEPEEATQYVAGADYTVMPGVTAGLSAFYTDRRNLVVQEPTLIVDQAYESYINRGYGASYGSELMVRARRDRFFGWVAYTLSRSVRTDGPYAEERLFDYDQTHNFIAVGSWRVGKWELGGKWQYTTGEPDTPVTGSILVSDLATYVPTFGEVNSTRIEAAHQLDLRVDRRWKFPDWELSAYLDIQNVYAHARTLGYQYNFDYTEREPFTTLPFFPALGVRGAF